MPVFLFSKNTMDIQNNSNSRTPRSRKLSIALCNIRGLKCNINSVHQLLSSSNPSILFLTETQISGSGDLTHLRFPNYNLFHCFRFKGGVCAYTNSSLPISHLSSLDTHTSQFQFFGWSCLGPDVTNIIAASTGHRTATTPQFFNLWPSTAKTSSSLTLLPKYAS